MAVVDTAALIARVRAIIDSGAGSIRTIDTARFRADYHAGLSDQEKAKRAVAAAPNGVYDVTARPLGRNGASPPLNHSLELVDVEVVVTVARAATFSEATKDATRDAGIAAAGADFDYLNQALGYPGNVTGAGLVSNLLRADGSPTFNIRTPGNGQPGLIETVTRFRGIAVVQQATS